MTPSPDTVVNYVEDALETLFEDDRPLLVNDSNERSITHRLAIYLEQEIKDLEPDYVVDVEYNRVTEENGATDSIKKRVSYDELTDSCRGRRIQDDDTDAQTVFPDIIVHERESSDHNLLVIELKKTSSTESGDCDKEKIVRFREDLCYKYGIFLQLRTDSEPEIAECALFFD
ncbi:hypothetical protein [Halorubrum salsamenti]|uniref:hypothetical protein n=1 Tax=Halorubrum salsamenti TaxID=2583990 RepID=UPI0011A17F8D|nr:hypothetical protein [Halorubrum salsamenti]